MKFQDLLAEHRIYYETEGRYSRPGWIQFRCPFCKGGRDPHKLYCGYNSAYNYVNCWRCGKHRVGDTLQELTGLRYGQLKESLSQLEAGRRKLPDRIERGTLVLPQGIGPMGPCHRRYLQSRKYDPNMIEALWNVQGIGMSQKLAWRLFIPIYWHGEVVSWTTRICSDNDEHPARYISAKPEQEIYSHKKLLYGEDYCRHTIIVVEGPTDVWRIGPGAAATLGQVYSRAQIRKIAKYAVRVICFDSEPEAQARARLICDLLEPFDGDTYNVTLDAKDPGSAGRKEIRQIREQFLGV